MDVRPLTMWLFRMFDLFSVFAYECTYLNFDCVSRVSIFKEKENAHLSLKMSTIVYRPAPLSGEQFLTSGRLVLRNTAIVSPLWIPIENLLRKLLTNRCGFEWDVVLTRAGCYTGSLISTTDYFLEFSNVAIINPAKLWLALSSKVQSSNVIRLNALWKVLSSRFTWT